MKRGIKHSMAEYIEKTSFIEHLKKDPLFDLVEQYGITGVIESFPAADVQTVKWIPVTERLPENDYNEEPDDVLIAYEDYVGVGYYLDETDSWYDKRSRKIFPTYWMPLPEPPKDGET